MRVDGVRRPPSSTRYRSPGRASATARETCAASAAPATRIRRPALRPPHLERRVDHEHRPSTLARTLADREEPRIVGRPRLVVGVERRDEGGIHRAQNANAAPRPRPNVSAAMLVSWSDRISSFGVRPVHAMIAAGSASTSVNSTSSAFG